MDDEVVLPGGNVTEVVRVGDTVRRAGGPDRGYVRRLLTLFADAGWSGAPRHLGEDEHGREVLEYLDGHVAWEGEQPADVTSDESLAAVAGLVRQFHDLTAGTALAGDHAVVCHHDLAPMNTVYRDDGAGLRPFAFIDWDIAGPGERVQDVAHVCWQYIGLGPGAEPVDAARRVRVVRDAYGQHLDGLVDTILWWQDRCWRGIEAEAAAGDPAKVALRDRGVCAAIRDAYEWVAAHRGILEGALD